MDRILSVDDFRSKHFFMEKVAEIKKPHEVLKDDRPIEVYCEDIDCAKDGKTWFWLFNQGEYVGNPITFPCDIEYSDRKQIGMDMINELLSVSEFRDLDLELQGKVPCDEKQGFISSCEECEIYKYGQGKDVEDSCIGAMYSIPSHMNWWQNTQEKWNKVYGEKSQKHKEYTAKKMIGYMNSFMHVCGDNKDLMKEVLDYGKNHTVNQHKNLFR